MKIGNNAHIGEWEATFVEYFHARLAAKSHVSAHVTKLQSPKSYDIMSRLRSARYARVAVVMTKPNHVREIG